MAKKSPRDKPAWEVGAVFGRAREQRAGGGRQITLNSREHRPNHETKSRETLAPKRRVSKARVGEILGLDASSILDDLLSQGLIYCDPSREVNFWRPTQSALLALGLRSHTDIPALKELEEWFDTQKEMQAIAKLDPYFERISRLASRRLKREIERRGTLGEFALEPDPSLKEDPHRGKRL
jgi:hypothetical protein